MAKNITPGSLLSSLSPGTVYEIEMRLQLNHNWERAAAAFTRRHGGLMFNYMQIELLRQHSTRASKEVIKTLITEGYTIKWFLDIMAKTELYIVADYITENVLRCKPIPRTPVEKPGGLLNNTTGIPPPAPPNNEARRMPSENTLRNTCFQSGNQTVPQGQSPFSERSFNIDFNSLHLDGGNKLQGETSDSQTMSYPNPDIYTGLPPIVSKIGEPHHFTYSLLEQVTRSFNKTEKCRGGHLIGEGGFGLVYYARYNNEQLAIKRLHDNNPVTRHEINTEIKTMSRVEHENILPLIGYSNDGPFCCVVYPYMINGSLQDCLECKYNSTPLSVEQRINIAFGLAEGILHLHNLPIIHRDIKSANVLLDEHFVPKLGDFGIAQHCPSLANPEKTSTRLLVVEGTVAYMAPETFQSQKISKKSDTYSFGVVLLELLTALKSYDVNREDRCLATHVDEVCGEDVEKMRQMLDKSIRSTFPKSVLSAFFSLALRCLSVKPAHRPDMTVVVEELQRLRK